MDKIPCTQCFKIVDASQTFKKHVKSVKEHPTEFREKHFCSMDCLRQFMNENRIEMTKKEVDPIRIYNWSGGVAGF